MTTLTISLDNIHCEACARRVANAVAKADPKAAVSVDVATGAVTVKDSTATREQLASALATAGYPPRP